VEKCNEVSKRHDNKEQKFLNRVLTLNPHKLKHCKILDYVPRRFVGFDRRLKPPLEALVAKHEPLLWEEIKQIKLAKNEKGLLITARRVLCMIYRTLSVDSSMLEVVTIASLVELRFENYGDGKAGEYLNQWIDLCTRMDNPLDDVHRHDLLRWNMSKSQGLKLSMRDYKKVPKKQRSEAALVKIFREWLHEKKEQK